MKLDLILENVRNKYSLGLLEESANISEKELLQGKILINESTMYIRNLLVEEGVMNTVKQNLEEAWTAALIQEFDMDDAQAAYDYTQNGAPEGALDQAATYAAKGVNAVSDAANQAGDYIAQHGGNAVSNAYNHAQTREAIDQGAAAGQAAAKTAGQYVDQGVAAATPYVDQGVAAAQDGLLTNGQAAAGLAAAGTGLALAGGRGKSAVEGVKYGYKYPNQAQLGSFNKPKKIGVRLGQAGNKIAGMVRR